MKTLDYDIERRLWAEGKLFVAGVDEAGRGPLAGPVVAAAVVFREEIRIKGVNDSKLLTPRHREDIYDRIMMGALSVGISVIDHLIIDEINILQATMRSMSEAVSQLQPVPDHLLIDGPRSPGGTIPSTPIIDGDALCFSIAAASIVAKVARDRLMTAYDERYPQYGFGKHKGYGTAQHLAALRTFGPCPIHRRSFRMPSLTGVARE